MHLFKPVDSQTDPSNRLDSLSRHLIPFGAGLLALGITVSVNGDKIVNRLRARPTPVEAKAWSQLNSEQRGQREVQLQETASSLSTYMSGEILRAYLSKGGKAQLLPDGRYHVSVISADRSIGAETTVGLTQDNKFDPNTATHTSFYQGFNPDGSAKGSDSSFWCLDKPGGKFGDTWRLRNEHNSSAADHFSSSVDPSDLVQGMNYSTANFVAEGQQVVNDLSSTLDKIKPRLASR